eukprot:CAMPEP_0177593542 /NCGR_PEP_ID=MMETSP0419_2-20121207/9214_1 /TAXON_ID=582737 /ORGANISM="Tetraselmis sp., Strain GSL018" /LENGTH=373 /DNA_ID=CAMNT_0019084613 /DNA_START=342 /DNA_END=1464 /DNA_ORIENTATION=+
MARGCSRRDRREFRQPGAQVIAARVVLLRLLHYVEAIKPPACEAGGRYPVAPVQCGIIVDERVLEVVRPAPPVHAVLHDEEARHVLSPTVRHVASGGDLPHVGIHERVSRPPLLPPLKELGPGVPLDPKPGAHQPKLRKDTPTVLGGEELVEVAREELEEDPVGRLVGGTLALVSGELPVDAPGGEAPRGEPRGQLGGEVPPEHPVAGVEVARDVVGVPEVELQAPERRVLAALAVRGGEVRLAAGSSHPGEALQLGRRGGPRREAVRAAGEREATRGWGLALELSPHRHGAFHRAPAGGAREPQRVKGVGCTDRAALPRLLPRRAEPGPGRVPWKPELSEAVGHILEAVREREIFAVQKGRAPLQLEPYAVR